MAISLETFYDVQISPGAGKSLNRLSLKRIGPYFWNVLREYEEVPICDNSTNYILLCASTRQGFIQVFVVLQLNHNQYLVTSLH